LQENKMATFDTPRPISVRIEAGGGAIRLVAGDRSDTVVEVRPRDETRGADVWAAEHTRVDFRDGKLFISGPRRGVPRLRGGAIDVEVALPSHSRLHASLASADLRAEGEFGDCKLASASGRVEVDAVTGKIRAANASGSFIVHRAEGKVSANTASGTLRIGELDGELKFQAASGSLTVETLRGTVKSRTASGSVRIVAAVRGGVAASTSSGELAIGVVEGTAARLDVFTRSGVVTNTLQPTDGPEQGDETFVVQARSSSGNVEIHRATPAQPIPAAAT
jgi:hypothetical protein